MTPQQFEMLGLPGKIAFLKGIEHLNERFEPGYTIFQFDMQGWLLEAYYHRREGFNHFRIMATEGLRSHRQSTGAVTMDTGSYQDPAPLHPLRARIQQWFTGILGRSSAIAHP